MIFLIHPAYSSRGKDRKAAILLATRSCFDQKGFCATSMSDIQKAYHTPRGVIYHYFFNKEELTCGPGRAMNLHVWSLAMLDSQVKLTLEASFEKIRVRLGRKLSALQLRGLYPKGAQLARQLLCGFYGATIQSARSVAGIMKLTDVTCCPCVRTLFWPFGPMRKAL